MMRVDPGAVGPLSSSVVPIFFKLLLERYLLKYLAKEKSRGKSQLIWEEAIHEYGDRDT